MDENRISELMKTLDLTRDEAIELIRDDEQVDKMGMKQVDDDLTEEQKKAIKKAKGGVRAVNAYGKKVTRERKENLTKASLIAEIAQFLEENSENTCEMVTITNKERQISFSIGSEKYELTLVQKRKPKK